MLESARGKRALRRSPEGKDVKREQPSVQSRGWSVQIF